MSFAAPVLLVCLLAVPVAVAAHLWLDRRREERAERWAPSPLLENMVVAPPPWRRHLPVALLLVGVALLLVGFARPEASIHVKRQDATVVLVLDVSGSMAAADSPPSRLAVARAAAGRLLDGLPKGYRMALVTFSDHAAVVEQPTRDVTAVRAALARAHAGPQGTALADAVTRAVTVARTVREPGSKRRPPALVVVFSDGGQTAGALSPAQAGRRAQRAGIPVTTVSVGTRDGIVHQQLKGGFTEQIQVPVQPAALQAIARASGGRFYAGAPFLDERALYRELGSRVGRQAKRVEVTAAAAAGGLAFILVGALLQGAWFRRIP